MSFKFNFSHDGEEGEEITQQESSGSKALPEVTVAPFRELDPETCDLSYAEEVDIKTYKLSDSVEVKCYDSTSLENKVSAIQKDNSAIFVALNAHSDLIPSVYEGGMTVWECGVDLAMYMASGTENWMDKKVLELGCGAGLPGICALRLGAGEVHFQDYNMEVLEFYTVRNVFSLNEGEMCKSRFFAGDWSFMSENAGEMLELRYDIILTAETIYNPDNYEKLHQCFVSMLKTGGKIIIAAKSNYFGVGGGTRSFESFVNMKDVFTCKIVHEIMAGLPREIIQLSWKQK